jgi:hypothetical protein
LLEVTEAVERLQKAGQAPTEEAIVADLNRELRERLRRLYGLPRPTRWPHFSAADEADEANLTWETALEYGRRSRRGVLGWLFTGWLARLAWRVVRRETQPRAAVAEAATLRRDGWPDDFEREVRKVEKALGIRKDATKATRVARVYNVLAFNAAVSVPPDKHRPPRAALARLLANTETTAKPDEPADPSLVDAIRAGHEGRIKDDEVRILRALAAAAAAERDSERAPQSR